MMVSGIVAVLAYPLPGPPHKGEGGHRGWGARTAKALAFGKDFPSARNPTSPLMGEARRG